MKVSTKGRYAIRLLLDLAEHQHDGFIPLKDIAARQGISKQYLEHIVTLLNTSNLLRGSRGKRGGYMLTRKPAEYSIGEILRATEGDLVPVACLEDTTNRCERAPSCKTLAMWQGLRNVTNDYLDSVTLQDLLDQHCEQGVIDYII
ncbi:MAG: Rrf2 family transcriptional regulator [Coriobacteriia bacterium]|nr:Rrf2 family transcriptional regulator [Coriobacteriia bacterium]